MKQIISVWVINLKKRPDRLEKIRKRLDQLGVEWKNIEAIDGHNCEESALNVSTKVGEIGFLSNNTRACSASHYKAWELLISKKVNYGIILEDDVELSDEFKDLLYDESWIPSRSNLIKLEKFAPNKVSKILIGSVLSHALGNTRHVHKMYSRHTGAAAYLLSRKGAEKLVEWNSQFTVPVDHLLFNETVSKVCTALNPMILIPPIAWQSVEVGQGSNIVDSYKLNPLSKLKKIKRSLKRLYYESRLWPYQFWILISGKAKLKSIFPK
ncbi:glycosyltransferase family 25 protein [Amylibacter sp.]|nr:glycosyltransferase family 25 protein [Amylibacter sp.]